MNTVLIDIDGTLFNSNSTFDFLDSLPHGVWYAKYRKFSSSIIGRIINNLSMLLFHKDIVRIIGVRCLKGYSVSKLNLLSERFYDDFLLPRKNVEIFEKLKEEQNKGSRIVLASATLDFLSSIICTKLNADISTATELNYFGGICQGTIAKDRLGHKLEALENQGIFFPVSLTITDNVTDVDLLLRSENKVIVIYPREANKWKRIKHRYHFENVKEVYYG